MFGTLQILVWVIPYFLKDPLERMGAFAFAMGSFLHTFFFFNSATDIYYLSAMSFDLFVIMAISSMRYSDFNFALVLISMGAMTTNLGGLLCFEFSLSPSFYEFSYLIMYCAVLALFLTGGFNGKGVGNPFHKTSFRWLSSRSGKHSFSQNVAAEKP